MSMKIFAAVVAVTLFLAYVGPIAFKLKEISLGVTILIGLAMMLVDLWQSLQKADD